MYLDGKKMSTYLYVSSQGVAFCIRQNDLWAVVLIAPRSNLGNFRKSLSQNIIQCSEVKPFQNQAEESPVEKLLISFSFGRLHFLGSADNN